MWSVGSSYVGRLGSEDIPVSGSCRYTVCMSVLMEYSSVWFGVRFRVTVGVRFKVGVMVRSKR